MALQIHLLELGDIELEGSFLVLGQDCGRVRRVPTHSYLITGGAYPILVDTGFRDNAIMESLGMRGLQYDDNMIENQLAKHGLKLGDIRYILHTHLHIDHAGKDDLFPLNTTVVLNRKEMEFSVSGLMYPQYPKEDIKHLVDRIYEPDAIRFLDLELTTAEEIMPGVWCESAGAHTEGSMNVIVETAEGLACICGDVIYDINKQVVNPPHVSNAMEPQVTGNHFGSKRGEKAAIKKLLSNYTFLLPMHDKPAKVERQRVVGRLGAIVPGPITETLPDRDWFPV